MHVEVTIQTLRHLWMEVEARQNTKHSGVRTIQFIKALKRAA
jgi:hypothetical protein